MTILYCDGWLIAFVALVFHYKQLDCACQNATYTVYDVRRTMMNSNLTGSGNSNAGVRRGS
jgi:hypothetical protein